MHGIDILHMRKAGGTSVVENVRGACGKGGVHVQEWGLFHRPKGYSILVLRDPLRRILSSYLFEGGHPQCWDTRMHRPEQLLRCIPRYSKLLPFDVYRNRSLQRWDERGARLTYDSEYEGVRVGNDGSIGRPYIPNYYVHKFAGTGNLTRAIEFLATVDMIVIPNRPPFQWSTRAVPSCLSEVPWHVRWSAEGYIHKQTAVDHMLTRAKQGAFQSMSLSRFTSILRQDNRLDDLLYRHVLRNTTWKPL